MREIKFRAWDEKNKIMHNDFQFVRSGTQNGSWILFVSDKQPLSDYDKWIKNPFAVQQFKIMQYTGIKDKSGKEIYEGDILHVNTGNARTSGYGAVEYFLTGCAFFVNGFLNNLFVDEYHERAKGKFCRPLEEHLIVEVVGNIYETPFLEDLEAKK
ncbi:MAG: YopX family protein [Elusimicrobiota bacterium]|jgi:uncharacterized phage protein (TIGR01671 family)|nr:YopX family protein [Elusimicrobiota bacterium]